MDPEHITQRRELIYSVTTLVCSLLTYALFLDLAGLITHISSFQELPLHTFVWLVGAEGLKLGTVHLMSPIQSGGGGGGRAPFFHANSNKLSSAPSSGAAAGGYGGGRKTGMSTRAKVLEFGSVCLQAVLCWIVCYAFVILFGAPLLSKFILTLQFSIILTGWMFVPLTFTFPAKDILKQVIYFSTWNTNIAAVSRAKLRLISTIAGAMSGVIVIPLDWDRPWQIWPVPTLFSAFLTVNAVNVGFLVYFLYQYRTASCNSSRGSNSINNKSKNY